MAKPKKKVLNFRVLWACRYKLDRSKWLNKMNTFARAQVPIHYATVSQFVDPHEAHIYIALGSWKSPQYTAAMHIPSKNERKIIIVYMLIKILWS